MPQAAAAQIETGFPIPTLRRKLGPISESLRALGAAEIGCSIFLADFTPAIIGHYVGRLGRGWYAARTVEGGCRIWKIAEPAKQDA